MRGRGTAAKRTGPWLMCLGAAIAFSSVVAACQSGLIVPGFGGAVPRCENVPQIEARPELYRPAPIYVANEMPADRLLEWAVDKPGFEEIWIDREHLGWLTVAFSRDAAARQAELEQEFPDVGVVAVQVDWTMAELQAIQAKVSAESPFAVSSGIYVTRGVVSINPGVLEPARVAEINTMFGGMRVCLEGIEPADAPVQGPQASGGDGWRMLADVDEIGQPYRTGIAADAGSLAVLWLEVGLPGAPPTVDFETEVAIWFGAVHGSSCPRLRFDGVVVDDERALVHPTITSLDIGGCTADAIGHAYVVAIERSELPNGPFTIQLQAEEPPPGAVEEKTLVDADLSVPGSTVTPDQLHSAPPPDDTPRVESGGFLEPGYGQMYLYDTRCGIEWLGEFNKVWWQTDVPPGVDRFVPPEWRSVADRDGSVDVSVTLTTDAESMIEAVAGNHAVSYRPSAEAAPACD